MIEKINTLDSNALYESMKDEINSSLGIRNYTIIISLEEINDANHILLDGKLLNKKDYPDLYNIFGDKYNSYYDGTIPDYQFAIPNLSGRYLMGGDNYNIIEPSIQSFALESIDEFATKTTSDTITRYFKGLKIRGNNIKLESEKVVKSIDATNIGSDRPSICIDDKCVLFYLKKN